MFYGEPNFENLGSSYLLCLVPRTWNIGTNTGFNSEDAEIYEKLRQACLLLLSSQVPGSIIDDHEFRTGE